MTVRYSPVNQAWFVFEAGRNAARRPHVKRVLMSPYNGGSKMKREMKLTAIRPDGSEVSIVRSFDNEQASGNFTVCRVRVNGRRFARISCVRELLVHHNHPSEAYRELYADIIGVTDAADWRAYGRYVKACKREGMNPHSRAMWQVHERPTGPLG